MRAVPVGYAFDDLDEVLAEGIRSAEVTHNHPEGIRGAQATALAVFMARRGDPKQEIRAAIESYFDYDLSRSIDEIRPGYEFDESCQRTVPKAITAFLESTGYEDAVRRATSLGGDADTLACIAGGIAEAHYGGVPQDIRVRGVALLDERLLEVLDRFAKKYGSATV
jgi:ADP-ribosylglycohydrolase